MPQKNARNKSGRRAPYLFMALAMLLLLALIFLGVRALNAWNAYEKAAAITPTPSPTVRPVSVTTPPDFVTYTPAPSPTPSYLTNGSSGEMVTQLQQRLKELGFYTGQIDGQYGSGTKSAVTLFQQQHNLDADGVAGQKTLAVLYSDNAKQVVITPSPAPVDTLDDSVPLLVNKQNPVGKDFVPADLVRVKDLAGDLFTYADNDTQGVREAVEALIAMIRDAENQGYTPWKLREGYRTYAAQKRIFDNQVEKYIAEREMTRTQAVSATRQKYSNWRSSMPRPPFVIQKTYRQTTKTILSILHGNVLSCGCQEKTKGRDAHARPRGLFKTLSEGEYPGPAFQAPGGAFRPAGASGGGPDDQRRRRADRLPLLCRTHCHGGGGSWLQRAGPVLRGQGQRGLLRRPPPGPL